MPTNAEIITIASVVIGVIAAVVSFIAIFKVKKLIDEQEKDLKEFPTPKKPFLKLVKDKPKSFGTTVLEEKEEKKFYEQELKV